MPFIPAAIDRTVAELSAHYRAEVIHGPGAFVEVARGYKDFEAAMRRKLLRESRRDPVTMLGTGPAVE